MNELVSLRNVLVGMPVIMVAVSGGVDSLTLGLIAHRAYPQRTSLVHAVSPAVPTEATERVRALAKLEGWRLSIVDAGEFTDPDYLKNPVDRCFHCKSNLFRALRRLGGGQILTGANVDDLAEYRPGLSAAALHGVRHPYIECGLDKAAVRRLARDLGFAAISELSASPCLASRVETGIPIDGGILQTLHAAEQCVRRETGATTVRVRLRAAGLVVELDPATLADLDTESQRRLEELIVPLFENRHANLGFAPYRVGSAFLVPSHDRS